jgi:hypothetical protein
VPTSVPMSVDDLLDVLRSASTDRARAAEASQRSVAGGV